MNWWRFSRQRKARDPDLSIGHVGWRYARGTLYLYLACVFVTALLCWAAERYLSAPVMTSFEADLNTTAMNFTVGKWDSAGLFNADQPVDVTVQEASTVVSETDPHRSCARAAAAAAGTEEEAALDPAETQFRLRHVQLDTLDVPVGTQVALHVNGGALTIELRRPTRSAAPMATFTAGPAANVCGLAFPATSNSTSGERWDALSASGESLQLTLHFAAGALPQPEETIPLGGERISFEHNGENALTGAHNTLVLGRDTHPLKLEHSRFEPTGISNGRLHELQLVQGSKADASAITALSFVLTGRSRTITIVSVYSDEAYNAAEEMVDQLHSGVSTHALYLVFGAIVAVLGLLSTVAGALSSLALVFSIRYGIVEHRQHLTEYGQEQQDRHTAEHQID